METYLNINVFDDIKDGIQQLLQSKIKPWFISKKNYSV